MCLRCHLKRVCLQRGGLDEPSEGIFKTKHLKYTSLLSLWHKTKKTTQNMLYSMNEINESIRMNETWFSLTARQELRFPVPETY